MLVLVKVGVGLMSVIGCCWIDCGKLGGRIVAM